jgi:hypothetical protein
MPHPNGFPTWAELKVMPEEELIEKIDHLHGYGGENRSHRLLIQIYNGELLRRPQDRATKEMIWLTRAITFLTVILVIGLVVQIWLTVKY